METGKTVVLLNLENLYESLYDALNQVYFVLKKYIKITLYLVTSRFIKFDMFYTLQYYSYFAGQRFVDLGLGTHRVKCRVDKKFK